MFVCFVVQKLERVVGLRFGRVASAACCRVLLYGLLPRSACGSNYPSSLINTPPSLAQLPASFLPSLPSPPHFILSVCPSITLKELTLFHSFVHSITPSSLSFIIFFLPPFLSAFILSSVFSPPLSPFITAVCLQPSFSLSPCLFPFLSLPPSLFLLLLFL